MSKEDKAAKKAEALAAKAAKKAATAAPVVNKPDQSAATVAPEKQEDPKPAPAPVVEPKKEEKPKDKPAAQKKGKPTPKEAPIVEVEVVEDGDKALLKKEKQLANTFASSKTFSPDAKAQLAYVIQKRYGENTDLQQQQPNLCAAMLENLDVVMVLSMVDLRNELVAREASGELELQGSPDTIIHFKELCATLGIKVTPVKALPSPSNENQLKINFKDAEIPDELKVEKRSDTVVTEEVVPELDPEKVSTEELLKEALNYLLSKSSQKRNIAESIYNTVEWFKDYATKKEKDAGKKAELEKRTVGVWLEDIFSHVSPTLIFRGLGSTLYHYCSQMGSPVMSHCILHRHLAPLGWSEDQIAETLKVLIQKKFQLKQEEKPEIQESEDKAIMALMNSKDANYINDILKDKTNKDSELGAVPIVTNIRSCYFESPQKVTDDMIRMKLGQILNLYRDPMNRMEEFAADMLAPNEGEYPAPAPEKKN